MATKIADITLSKQVGTVLTLKTKGKFVDDDVYFNLNVSSGSVVPAIDSHSITTIPAVTGSISGTITNIGTDIQPNGTDGTDYWTINPTGQVTTTGVSTANAKATVTAGYIATSPASSNNHTVNIVPSIVNGTKRYIPKATFQVGGEKVYCNSSGYVIESSSNPVGTINAGTATTPTDTITATPAIQINSAGLITATNNASKSITPVVTAGYVSTGIAGTISVNGSNTLQLSTQASQTITPTEETQTAVSSGKYTTGDVFVGPISSTYVGSAIPRNDDDNIHLTDNMINVDRGYYDEDGTKIIPVGTVTSGTASITSVSVSNGADESKFVVSGSANVSAPTVGTAGYISSSKGTKNAKTNGASVSASIDKIIGTASIAGLTKKPSITKRDTPSGVTNAASGDATTTAPSSGVYVAVKSDGLTEKITPTISITTPGYGTNSKHGITATGANVGAAPSDLTYVPITTTTASVNGKTVSYGSGWITGGSTSVADGAYTPSVTSQGTSTAASFTPSTTGTITDIIVSEKPSGTDGTDFWTITPSGSKTNGVARAKATATIDSSGYIEAGSKTTSSYKTWTLTTNVNTGTNSYIPKSNVTEGITTVSSSTANRGKWTQTAGYTAAREIPAATFSNSVASGKTASNYVDISDTDQAPVLDTQDGFLFINKGYTDDLKISLAKLVPDGASADLSSNVIRSGYSAYNNDGVLVAGNIQTLTSADLTVSGRTVTVPVHKYTGTSSSTALTKSISTGKVTSGTASITSVTVSDGSNDNTFVLSGSANVSAPTVNTAGYISSSEGTKSSNSNGAALNATVPKIGGTVAISRTTAKPSISRQSVPSGVTDASSGAATTTAPSSGVYVAVRSAEITTTVTPSITINQDGYGTSEKHGITATSAAVGAAQSDITYIPIKSAIPLFTSPTPTGGSTASGTNIGLTSGDNGIRVRTYYSVDQATITYNNDVNAWVNRPKNTEAVRTTARGSTAGTAYSVTGVTVPKDVNFTVTMSSDTELDTNSDLDVTNNAFRRVDVNNKQDATTYVDNKGEVLVRHNPDTGNTVYGLTKVSAMISGGSTTLTMATVVENGYWKDTSVTNSGTFYGRVVVPQGSATTPTTSFGVTASANINSNGLITITGSGSRTITPTVSRGFITAGTSGNVSVTVSGQRQLTTKAATTWTPTTTNQTISSGTYLTGAQTILGSSYLTAANIKKGVTIFNVQGSYSSAPSGYTALSASALRSGYVGFVNGGSAIYGSMPDSAVTETVTSVSGTAAVRGTWALSQGYTSARSIGAATFSNTASSGKTYIDISETTSAPVLTAGGSLYINRGFTDYLEIKLSRLAPAGDYTPSVVTNGTKTAAAFTPKTTGTITNITTTTLPSGTDGTDFWTITPSGDKTTGVARTKAKATIGTAGYIAAGSKTTDSYTEWNITTNVNAGTNSYIPKAAFSASGAGVYCSSAGYIPAGDASSPVATVSSGTVKASVSSNTSGKASMSASGFTASSNATDYYVLLSTTAGSVKAKAAGDTAGYVTSATTNETSATSVSVTGNGNKCYIPVGAVTASVSSNSGGSASMAVTGMATTTTATSYYITLTTTAGSVKAKAVGSTAGYITTSTTNETAATSVAVSGNGTKYYIKAAAIAGSSTNATATTTVAPGAVTVSKQNVPSGVTQAASGNATTTAPTSGVYVAVKAAVAANSTGTTSAISGSGTATVTTAGYAPGTLTGTVTVSGTATAKSSAKESSMTYVPITTASPTFSSPTPSGGSTATGTNATLNSTDNGIKIQTAYTVNQASVTYNAAVNGWVTKTSGTEAVKTTARTSTNGTAYYVSAVKLVKPSSGTRAFTVTAPDKNGTDHTYLFTTDTAGNTSIKVDNTLTMQWNETDQSMDFIYT